ncbi:nuclear receptor coactivator 6 isoform X2 [Uranotaenia lowii]|uniref:nuclear receptor coactivator 6 isoform X2 n=1 Tax=Uranotaenia lowii TaxID=190385 RepID=UPI00247A5089|nr:nuclear receptor coactivator 6 isoform X2 [Uranotaenia lowii]
MSKTKTIPAVKGAARPSGGLTQIVGEFDVPGFETKLRDLKDTQDGIQQMSAWCLQRRAHHKKIVTSWLNVLKQVKVEHRLTLFYLANDVIQYSKRKNYEFVDSWGTYLQKATTMVRDEKVKNKILRIFKIWEQREIYNDEFLADLNGLLSATTAAAAAKKNDSSVSASTKSISDRAGSSSPSLKATLGAQMPTGPTKLAEIKQATAVLDVEDFQTGSLVSSIKECVKNENDTDTTFKSLNKTPLIDVELVRSSIKGKERKKVEEVEREIEENFVHYQSYVHSLKTEIKSRKLLLTLLEQAETFYHSQRGEVKVVANAYRNFGNRLKNMKKKLDELTTTLPSPIPSPDINAPSPEPEDLDLQLPDDQGFFNVNGMMSGYMDGNLPFDISDFRRDSPTSSAVQSIQVIGSRKEETEGVDTFLKSFFRDAPESQHFPSIGAPQRNSSGSQAYVPSQSSSSSLDDYSNGTGVGVTAAANGPDYLAPLNSYGVSSMNVGSSEYGIPTLNNSRANNHHSRGYSGGPPAPVPPAGGGSQYGQPMLSDYSAGRAQPPGGSRGPPLLPPPGPPVNLDRSDEYNSTWDMSMSWDGPHDTTGFQSLDTPVSPPHYERKGANSNMIEYIDGSVVNEDGPLQDVDHRQLPGGMISLPSAFMKDKGRLMDVDHRNLISLTGSPGPLLAAMKSSDEQGLEDVDADEDDEDSEILLTGQKKSKSDSPMGGPSSYWITNSSGDVDLRHSNLSVVAPMPVPAPKTGSTTSSSSNSITVVPINSSTTEQSESKDLDMRIQSMQKTFDSHFGGETSESEKASDGETAKSLQSLQLPSSLLEIDDFLQNFERENFERENFDLSKPPTLLMSNQSEVSLSPPPSLPEANASTPMRSKPSAEEETLEKKPTDNNESVDMELSDEDGGILPELPDAALSAIAGGPAELIEEQDSTEPYEPFEGEEIDDEPIRTNLHSEVPEVMQRAISPLRPPLLPDPDFAPFLFPPQPPQHQQQQQQQSQQMSPMQQQQQKPWEMPPHQPPNNNFSGLTNLMDLAPFGEFPNVAPGMNNFNHQGTPTAIPPPMPPIWNGPQQQQQQQHHHQFGSPNRAPFGGGGMPQGGPPFNNNFRQQNNSWGPNRGGMGGGGPRHGSPGAPYFRGGRGGGRGNFRGGNNKFRGGGGGDNYHNNNRGAQWLDKFLASGGNVLDLINRCSD